MNPQRQHPVLLAHPFRPFFLLTGIYAVASVAAWLAFMVGGWPLPLGWTPLKWHSHEMLYGLVTAATAGFVLTAMTNWTGARPLQGRALLALLGLWLAGRVAMWLAGWLPVELVAAVDFAFLPVLTLYVAWVLARHGNRRNFVLVAVLTLLSAGNLMMHVGFVSGSHYWLQLGQVHGFDVITLLMVIIAGRITPAFTANWLRLHGGRAEAVARPAWLEVIAIGSVVLLLPLNWLGAPAFWIGAVAVLAGIANLVRLAQWSGWRAAREPLLWILHLSYLGIAAALLLRGASAFSAAVPASAWQHTLGVTGIGSLILGVMTRVTVGHTGRPMALQRFGIGIYLAILGAGVVRILTSLQWLDFRLGVSLAGLGWMLAFTLFVIIYGPMPARPRADGRPG